MLKNHSASSFASFINETFFKIEMILFFSSREGAKSVKTLLRQKVGRQFRSSAIFVPACKAFTINDKKVLEEIFEARGIVPKTNHGALSITIGQA